MIENVTLKIQNDGKIIEVELEPQRRDAVIKLLGIEIDGENVIMTRRNWKRINKVPISDKQLKLFPEI